MNRPGHTRRGFLCSMGAAASAWTLSGCAPGPAPGAAAPADVGVDRTTLTGDVEGFDTSLVLLGTAGGPGYWPGRTGIASVLRVGDRRYLVDAGTSTVRRMGQAAIRSADLTAAFVTHMHSDHIADLFGLFWLDVRWYQGAAPRGPVPVYGPGPVDGGATSAMSGVGELLAALRAAYGHEIAVRNADAGRPVDFATVVEGRAVVVPPEVRASPAEPAPDMEPFAVYEDDHVRVSAVLVPHGAAFPSLAYRFDTDAGSVTFSGDTARSANVTRLAARTDILVHEAIDLGYFAGLGLPEQLLDHLHHHTLPDEVGSVATDSGARRVILSHVAPADPRLVPDERWAEQVAPCYSGPVVVGQDLTVFGVGARK